MFGGDIEESVVAGVQRVGVIGSGQMGSGIVQVAAVSGFDVVLRSRNQATAEGTAAAQLRTHLAKVDDAADHAGAAQAFLDACKARPAAEFLADAMKVVSLQRNAARQLPVMEFPPTLPIDASKTDPATFFDPATCTLVTP